MTYISSKQRIRVKKKLIDKKNGTYQDVLDVRCPECKRRYEHIIKYTIKCPYCKHSITTITNTPTKITTT